MANTVKRVVGNVVLGVFAVFAISLASTSCKKKSPPKAEITVVDSTGTAVASARVILHCIQRPEEQRECTVADTQTTDEVGKVSFEFENPAVLKIDVSKLDVVTKDTGKFPNIGTITVGDTLCADGFITLEIDEVIEQRMVLGKCSSVN